MPRHRAADPPRKGRALRGARKEDQDQALVGLRRQTHRERNEDAQTTFAFLRALAGNPDLHAYAHLIDAWTQRDAALGGRPPKHPTWALVLFGTCISVFGSASAAARELADPEVWRMVCGAAAGHRDPAEPLPDRGPSRDQWHYFASRRITGSLLGDLQTEQRRRAAALAREIGLLDPDAGRRSQLDRTHTVGIDGKVFSSPLRTLEAEQVDRRTGEIRPIRQDPARRLYGEGGEEACVWGTKFALASVRSPFTGHRVVLGMQYIAADGRGEGGAFTDLMTDLARRNPGIRGYVTDGALRGTHIGPVQVVTGCTVVSPPRRKTKKGGGIVIDKFGFAARALPPSRTRDAWLGECGGHDLWAAGGTLFERVVTSDGSPRFPEVPRGQVKRQRKPDGTYAYYAHFRLPCPRSGSTHVWWEPLTPIKGDARHGFNRSEYLRVLPGNDPDYNRVYGMRADTESLNATLEQAFHKQRLPAWGLHNQTVVVLMAVIAQNSWARHVWNRELDRQHPPPDREAA